MHAALLHVLSGDPSTDSLSSRLGNGFPAADIDATRYLDGRTIHHGTLAARVTNDVDVPVVTDDGIHTERDEATRRVQTDAYIDLADAWAGVDAGAGVSVLEDYLISQAGVLPEPTELRLDAWAERIETIEDADVWGVAYSQSIEDGHDADRSGALYHDDASKHELPVSGKSVLGFSYPWNGTYVRGTITKSAYVAVYRDWPVEQFATWVADEVAEYLQYQTDDQQALRSAMPECDRCGRDSESVQDGLCIVCRSKVEEGGESSAD